MNSNVPFGMRHVLPIIPQFLAQNPEVTLDLILSDTVIDLLEERADIAIRAGPLRESSLMVRKLGTSRMSVVASPDYLARYGTPRSPDELVRHKGIGWTFARIHEGWPFRNGKSVDALSPPAIGRASDGEVARRLALGGTGLARLALFHIGSDIEAGDLVPVLEEFNPGDCEDIHAVYLGQGGPLPSRVRAFIDFLADHIRLESLRLARPGHGKWKIVPEARSRAPRR